MIRAAAVVVARRVALVISRSILGLVSGVTDEPDARGSSIRCRNDQETTLTKAVAFTFGNAGPHSSADATGRDDRSLVASMRPVAPAGILAGSAGASAGGCSRHVRLPQGPVQRQGLQASDGHC